ncbi:MAG: DJ-1/PfpI family protein [Pseudomonadota bacterium]
MKIVTYIYDGLTALDAIGPYEALSRIPEVECIFAGKCKTIVRTGDGFLGLNADIAIADIDTCDYLLLPGGNADGVRACMEDEELKTWIKHMDLVTKRTCAVCTGSLILAACGLLDGKTASTHWNAKDYLAHFGASYSADRISVDGKLMTSAGVSAGIDMGLLLCEELAGRSIAEAIELSMQYNPEPPYGTGDPAIVPESTTAVAMTKLRL